MEPTEDMVPVQAGMVGARVSGYGWDEISDHYNTAINGGLAAGHSREAVDAHLGYPEQTPIHTALQHAWDDSLHAHEDLGAALMKPDSLLTPARRYDYGDALKAGYSGTPQEFAADFLARAQEVHEKVAGATVDADPAAIADKLPAVPEILDYATALTHDAGREITSANINTVKNNIIDKWAETGATPREQYEQAQHDPEFRDSLLRGKEPPPPTPWDLANADAQVGEEFGDRLGELVTAHAVGIFNDWMEWSDRQHDIEARGVGKPLAERVLDHESLDTAINVALGVFSPSEAIGKLGLKWTSVVPEGSAGDIVARLSPEALDRIAKEQGPIHEEAARISNLPMEAREAELAKLDMAEEGAKPLLDRKAVEEQLPAYDAARGIYQFAKSLIGDVLEDESGALTLPKWSTPKEAAEHALSEGRKDAAQMALIKGMGQDSRTMAQFAKQLQKLQGLVTPHVAEFEAATKAKDADGAINSVIGNLISYMENRSLGVTLANSKLQPVADAIRNVNVVMQQRLQAAHDAGLIGLNEFRDNYFRHLWEDPRGPEWEALWADRPPGSAGRQGSGQSLQQRTLPTYYDGLKAGLRPRIHNPIDLTIFDLGQKTHYLTALRVIEEAKEADHAYYALGPRSPGDQQLLGSRSQFAVGSGLEMKLYGKDGYHQSYNNWLSEGMQRYPPTATMYERLMWIGNMSTAIKLANPMFHARVVGLASWASGLGQAMEELGRGQVGQAAIHVVEAGTLLPRVVTDSVVGFKGLRTFRSGADDPVLTYLYESGLRVGPRQSVYKVGSESLVATAQRGVAEGEGLWTNTLGAGREIAKAIGKDILAVGGNAETESTLKRLVLGVPRGLALPLTELGRAMQSVTSPLFDHWIPALKLGASYRRLDSWLDANRMASEEAKWQRARQIVKDVDNRYGELNQDTLFIPRLAKQSANLTLISTGWNYGTYRGFLGALGIDAERGKLAWNPTVATSTVGTVVAYSIFNTLEQVMRTGTAPWQTDTPLRDLVNYRTGYTTESGSPERGIVPSELKEIFDLGRILVNGMADAGLVGPATLDYVLGKVNPFFQFIRALATGQDGAHNDIYVPGGFEKFLQQNFSPIFIEQLKALRKNSGFGAWSAAFGDREVGRAAEDPVDLINQLERGRAGAARRQNFRDYREENRRIAPGSAAPPDNIPRPIPVDELSPSR